jgi:hypothetical protein
VRLLAPFFKPTQGSIGAPRSRQGGHRKPCPQPLRRSPRAAELGGAVRARAAVRPAQRRVPPPPLRHAPRRGQRCAVGPVFHRALPPRQPRGIPVVRTWAGRRAARARKAACVEMPWGGRAVRRRHHHGPGCLACCPLTASLPRPAACSYWLRFALLGSIEVPLYAWRRGRQAWALRTAAAIACYWAVVVVLWARNPVATLYTLVLPYALSSLLLMFGNWCGPSRFKGEGRSFQYHWPVQVCPAACLQLWADSRGQGCEPPPTPGSDPRLRPPNPFARPHRSQHVFVDPDSPGDDYTLTYNCLACPDNARTYNDGYHVVHHANSRLHWSELPARFLATLDAHDSRDGRPGQRRATASRGRCWRGGSFQRG